jgi:hypothetical protein
MKCELTGGECRYQEHKRRINTLRATASSATALIEYAQTDERIKELQDAAKSSTATADALQADINAHACSVCSNKTA